MLFVSLRSTFLDRITGFEDLQDFFAKAKRWIGGIFY
jgi:hypothetical protein